jgi:hypothetical protein
MTEHDRPLSPDDDVEPEKLFETLKNLEPPLEARAAFRIAVASELARSYQASCSQLKPWWRRSVSIPVPVAMALGILVVAGLWWSPSRFQRNDLVKTNAAPEHSVSSHSSVEPQLASNCQDVANPTFRRYVSNTYLCGLGPISTETHFDFEE